MRKEVELPSLEALQAEKKRLEHKKRYRRALLSTVGVLAVVAAGVYALAATGRMGDVWGKMKRSLSELTGGSAGKRK